jgi:DNA-binding transcriptional ArsR family regulator
MVDYSNAPLDLAFAALADPTRRAIVDRLARESELAVTEIAGRFTVSLPAVMKHLDVLANAGLVKRSKTGRVVACALDARPMQQANEWLERYAQFWAENFARLDAYLENEKWTPLPSNPVSPSRSASTSRPRGSTPRGRTPKSS